MSNDTESTTDDGTSDDAPQTSGHVEWTVLHRMAGSGDARPEPTTVGTVSDAVGAIIERGGYANVGPNTAAAGTVRKSTIRRTLTGLHEKGFVRRVADLDLEELRDDRVDLGELPEGGDPADPAAYSGTSDDARVTDWLLTEAGEREVGRLDARYESELDDLAARYGRPRGETTDRVDA